MGPFRWKLKTAIFSALTRHKTTAAAKVTRLSGARPPPRYRSPYIPAEEANISAQGATLRLTATHLSSGLKVVGVFEVSLVKSFDFVLEWIITGYTTG